MARAPIRALISRLAFYPDIFIWQHFAVRPEPGLAMIDIPAHPVGDHEGQRHGEEDADPGKSQGEPVTHYQFPGFAVKPARCWAIVISIQAF